MKTKSKIINVLLIGLAMFISLNTKAQCPYYVSSNFNCPVTVDIVIYSTPPPVCTTVCNTAQTGINIAANNGVYTISCSGCANPCNIEVTVTHINGSLLITPPMADFNNGTQPLPTIGACAAGAVIEYDAGGKTFKIH